MTIPQEAIEAASKSLFPTLDVGEWDEQSRKSQKHWMTDLETALEAALPALEQQIREKVAAEIRRECDVLSSSTVNEYVVIHVKTGLERAARIAQGRD